jgi:hypothetical protein
LWRYLVIARPTRSSKITEGVEFKLVKRTASIT